jgi:NAD(P)-dependent dehydrogenase (short-subunit alcohol dehydrogenase family)
MNDKLYLITGATSGIGKETARALADQGARVVVGGRNAQKAEKTVAWIKAETGNEAVDYLLADFASLDAVREMAAQFRARYDRLDGLINNAGAYYATRQESADGIELTLAVNHLAHFLLTHLLLDLLRVSAPARIVNVSSVAHQRATMDFDNLEFESGYSQIGAYGRSKLCNILFTYELARRLEGSGVTANALHPGLVATNIGSNNFPVYGRPLRKLAKKVINRAGLSAEEGAETVIYLAASPEVEGVTGRYYYKKQSVESSPLSYDEAVGRRLWEVSAALVGLMAEELA